MARNRRALVNARPSADLDAAGLSDLHTNLQSALVCPLLFGERFIGALRVYHVDAAFYRDDHRRLLDRVSEQAAAVINNSMLFEQTQEDSLTDPLTGLPNTRFLFMHLSRELARAERLKTEVSLMVMDLDNFKRHQRQPRSPRRRPRALRSRARAARRDPSVRHLRPLRRRRVHRGAVGLRRGRGREQARRSCRTASTKCSSRRGRAGKLRLGVSVGTAVFPHDGESYEALLAAADSRMYQDKAQPKARRPAVTPHHARRVAVPGRRPTSISSGRRRGTSNW